MPVDPSSPTWVLVLEAVRRLSAQRGEFSLANVVSAVQVVDPQRDRTTIQTLQGMTKNAGKGPASPCGKPLVRIRHGWYVLDD
jgi:hypothetical protein